MRSLYCEQCMKLVQQDCLIAVLCSSSTCVCGAGLCHMPCHAMPHMPCQHTQNDETAVLIHFRTYACQALLAQALDNHRHHRYADVIAGQTAAPYWPAAVQQPPTTAPGIHAAHSYGCHAPAAGHAVAAAVLAPSTSTSSGVGPTRCLLC